jgi:hypothetical protein
MKNRLIHTTARRYAEIVFECHGSLLREKISGENPFFKDLLNMNTHTRNNPLRLFMGSTLDGVWHSCFG